MSYARVEPIIALFFILALPVISQATDFDDCSTAAGYLKDAAEEADSARQHFDSAKDDYSRRSAVSRLAQKLNQENQELRAQLRSCQGAPKNTAPSHSGK